MFYRKNVGAKERWSRILAGGLIVACAFSQLGATPLGWLFAGAGVFTALTGLVGFCPACAMVGRKPLEGPR